MINLLLEDGGDLLLEDGAQLLLEDGVIPPVAPEYTDVGGIYFWRPPLERLEITLRADLLAPVATHEGFARVVLPTHVDGELTAAPATHAGEARVIAPTRVNGALVAPPPGAAGKARVPRGRAERELLELLLR